MASSDGIGQEKQSATVVVDANVIIRSPRLNSATWRALLHARDQGALDLRVPEVALLEAVAWFEREVPERVKRFRRQTSLLLQVGIDLDRHGALESSAVDRLGRDVIEQYESYLRERIGATAVHPFPTVDHRALVERAIGRVKPFSDSGSGYRDALIWESLCEIASSNRSIAFVSNNTKDFAAADGTLAGDLVSDLERRGIAQSEVRLFTDLLDVVTLYAPEAKDERARVEHVMTGARAVAQLEEEFAQAFATHEGIPLPEGTPGLHVLMFDAAVQHVWDLQDIRVEHVKPVGDAGYVVVGTARGMAEAYSVREQADIADVDAARAGVDSGLIGGWFQRGPDLVLLKQLPVHLRFEANLETGDWVWNAGVVDLVP